MEHVSYGLFDDADRARVAINAIEANRTPRRHCGVVLHENQLDKDALGIAETRAGAGLREVAVVNGLLGAAIGSATVGPVGLVAGGALGALLGAIGGATAGSMHPDRSLQRLSQRLAEGKILVIVEAPDIASRERADATMRAHGAYVEHKPFF